MSAFTLPSYGEIIQFLGSFANMELSAAASRSYLDGTARMSRLLKRLGSPHLGIPAIHIAGTKGKGSTSHLAAAVLSAAGIRTGVYTSPHVESPRERIHIDRRMVDKQRFIEAAAMVLREAEAMRAESDAPSWFEIMTAVAFVAFGDAGVEAMVMETGMGGRLDATNVPDINVVAVGITPISLDHEDMLGDTLEKIAGEKLAIIRPDVPVVAAPQEAGVMRLIREKTTRSHARLLTIGKEIAAEVTRRPGARAPFLQDIGVDIPRRSYRPTPPIRLAMLGDHQAANAGMALGLADLFLEYMDRGPIDDRGLRKAWRRLSLPARFEPMGDNPLIVVDGAHNPASAWAAAETISQFFPKPDRVMIFGSSRDKNHRAMLRILAPLFRNIVFTPFASPRASDPEELASFARTEFPAVAVSVAANPAHALETARLLASDRGEGFILATGSFYLAGEIRAILPKEKPL